MRVLNRVLPKDIRVMGWCPVPIGFHARFVYLYNISLSSFFPPFGSNNDDQVVCLSRFCQKDSVLL